MEDFCWQKLRLLDELIAEGRGLQNVLTAAKERAVETEFALATLLLPELQTESQKTMADLDGIGEKLEQLDLDIKGKADVASLNPKCTEISHSLETSINAAEEVQNTGAN